MIREGNLVIRWDDNFPVDECKKGVSVATIVCPRGLSLAQEMAGNLKTRHGIFVVSESLMTDEEIAEAEKEIKKLYEGIEMEIDLKSLEYKD